MDTSTGWMQVALGFAWGALGLMALLGVKSWGSWSLIDRRYIGTGKLALGAGTTTLGLGVVFHQGIWSTALALALAVGGAVLSWFGYRHSSERR